MAAHQCNYACHIDGNDATVADPAWTPVVPTPNHPEYPAAHSCITAMKVQTDLPSQARMSMEALRNFYGLGHLAARNCRQLNGRLAAAIGIDDGPISEEITRRLNAALQIANRYLPAGVAPIEVVRISLK
jgi:hypothetical protein